MVARKTKPKTKQQKIDEVELRFYKKFGALSFREGVMASKFAKRRRKIEVERENALKRIERSK